jgi:hypothetical protein
VPGLVERVLVALVSIIRLLANDLSRYISLQIEPPEGSSLIEYKSESPLLIPTRYWGIATRVLWGDEVFCCQNQNVIIPPDHIDALFFIFNFSVWPVGEEARTNGSSQASPHSVLKFILSAVMETLAVECWTIIR